MKKINIRNLLKQKMPSEILTEYMEGRINLTQIQIQSLINKKTGRDVGRGRAWIGGKK